MLLFKIDYSTSLNLPQNDEHELALTMEPELGRFPPPAIAFSQTIFSPFPATPDVP